MPRLIAGPTIIQAAGNKPKRIEEYAGRVNSGHGNVSVARMVSPAGWIEPGQRPEFEEITLEIVFDALRSVKEARQHLIGLSSTPCILGKAKDRSHKPRKPY